MNRIAYALFAVVCLGIAAWGQGPVQQVGMIDLPGEPGFDEMVFAKGMLLLSHPDAGTVDIFDPAKRRSVGQVQQLSGPRGLAVSEDGALVFIANSRGRSVVVLGTEDWQVKETIAVDGVPERLLWVEPWKRLLVTIPAMSAVAAIDVEHRAQTGTAKVGGKPEYLAFDASRGQAYVTLQDARKIAAFDSALNVVRSMPVQGSMPTGLSYDPQADHLYVAVRSAIVSMNASTGEESSRVAAPVGIDQLWLDVKDRLLLGYSTGKLLVLRAGSKLEAPQEVKVELAGHTVAFDAAKKSIYVPGGREGRSKLVILREGAAAAPPEPQEARK